MVLGGRLFSKDLSKHEVIRIADLLGWPSDIGLWRRLLTWTLNRVDSFPCTIIPAVVSTFEVWQNAVADVPNTLSNSIAKKCLEWLVDIEDRRHSEEWNSDYGKWDVLDRDDLDGLEKALRMLVLRSAQTFHPGVKAYLERATQRKHLRSHVFMEVLKFAPLLAQKLSDQLIELTRAELKDELPEDTETRWKREQEEEAKELERIRAKPENERDGFDESILSSLPIYSGFSHHDWTRLSIGRSHQGFFPASPLREPFASLFNYQPQKAVALVKEITNHAITAWLQLHKYDHDRRGTPIPVAIEFPWGRQEFWGDWPHYVWFRGLLGPNSVECGLMALEGWAFREIDSGRVIDEVLRDVVDGHRCWSVLGIAIAIALETQHVSKTTLALLSCQRLWHIDIRRQVEDSGSVSANLIGFIGVTGFKEAEKSHYETVKAGNGKKCRKMSLRDLTMLFALNEDEEIRRLTRKALERFPDNLPFGYEEEKADEARVKELLTTAEIWAEAGKPENYMSKPYPEDESAVLIELQNPKLSNPEIQAALVRHSNKTRELSLWNWVNKTFDNKTLCNDLSLTDAIEYAKQFDHPDLFSSRVSSADSDLLLGAVAGVAATVFCFANPADQNVVAWAAEVISRAYETPEVKYDIYSSGAHLPWHPCIFVARALSAQIRQRYADHSAKEKLLCLVGHPLEQVSLEALVGAFDCWNVDDRFAWTALDLGLRLSVASFRGAVHWSYGYDPAKDLAAREKAVEAALKSYFDASEYTELTSPPQPWVFAPPRTDNLLDGERV